MQGEVLCSCGRHYQTDFIIMKKDDIEEANGTIVRYGERIAAGLEETVCANADEVRRISPALGRLDLESLLWICAPMIRHAATNEAVTRNNMKSIPPPLRREGGRWYLNGWEGERKSHVWATGNSVALYNESGSSVLWSPVLTHRAGNLDRDQLLIAKAVAEGKNSLAALAEELGMACDILEEKLSAMAARGFCQVEQGQILLRVPLLLGQEKEDLVALTRKLSASVVEDITEMHQALANQLQQRVPARLKSQFPSLIPVVSSNIDGCVFDYWLKRRSVSLPVELDRCVKGIWAWA